MVEERCAAIAVSAFEVRACFAVDATTATCFTVAMRNIRDTGGKGSRE